MLRLGKFRSSSEVNCKLLDFTLGKCLLTFNRKHEEELFREYVYEFSGQQSTLIFGLLGTACFLGYLNLEQHKRASWKYVLLEAACFTLFFCFCFTMVKRTPGWFRLLVRKNYHKFIFVMSCHVLISELSVCVVKEVTEGQEKDCEFYPRNCPNMCWNPRTNVVRGFLLIILNSSVGLLFQHALYINVAFGIAFIPTLFPWGENTDEVLNKTDPVVLLPLISTIMVMFFTLRRCYNNELYQRLSFSQLHKLNVCRRLISIMMGSMLPLRFQSPLQKGSLKNSPEDVDEKNASGKKFIDLDKFGHITVLVCGFKDDDVLQFEEPDEFVQLVAVCITAFDELVQEKGLYKVEHIGENYIVTSPEVYYGTNSGKHCTPEARRRAARNLVAVAQEFVNLGLGFMSRSGVCLHFSCALHSGPACGAVVGRTRRFYRLFGKTVSDAGKMCRTCPVGYVEVSESTKLLLEDSKVILEDSTTVRKELASRSSNSRRPARSTTATSSHPGKKESGTDHGSQEEFKDDNAKLSISRANICRRDHCETRWSISDREAISQAVPQDQNVSSTFFQGNADTDCVQDDTQCSISTTSSVLDSVSTEVEDSVQALEQFNCTRIPSVSSQTPIEDFSFATYFVVNTKELKKTPTNEWLRNIQEPVVESSKDLNMIGNEWLHALLSAARGNLSRYTGQFRSNQVEGRFKFALREVIWRSTKTYLKLLLITLALYFVVLYTVIVTGDHQSSCDGYCPVLLGVGSVSSVGASLVHMRYQSCGELGYMTYRWWGISVSGIALLLQLILCNTEFALMGTCFFFLVWADCERFLPYIAATVLFQTGESIIMTYFYHELAKDWMIVFGYPIFKILIFAAIFRGYNITFRIKWTLDETLEIKYSELDSMLIDLIPCAEARKFMMEWQLQHLEYNLFSYNVCSMWVTQETQGVVMSTGIANYKELSCALGPHDVAVLLHDIWYLFDTVIKSHAETDTCGDVVNQRPFKMDIAGSSYISVTNLGFVSKGTQRAAAQDMILLASKMVEEADAYPVQEISVRSNLSSSSSENTQVSESDAQQANDRLTAVGSPEPAPPKVLLRMGLSLGEVIAGIVGFIQPRYHLYGKPVKQAVRMEARADAGCIVLCKDLATALHSSSDCLSINLTEAFF